MGILGGAPATHHTLTMRTGAVGLTLRCELRRRTGSFVVAALIAGLAGGAALTAAAGARRSDSAYDRFLAWSRPAQLFTGGYSGSDAEFKADLAALEHAPFADGVVHISGASADVRTRDGDVLPQFQVSVGVNEDYTAEQAVFHRPKLLHGRAPDPASATDAIISFNTAEYLGAHVGDSITLVPSGDVPGHPKPTTVKVAAVVAFPGEFPTISGAANRGLILTPAFHRAHPTWFQVGNTGLGVRLRTGTPESGVKQWINAHVKTTDILRGDATEGAIKRTMHIETVALWIVTAVLALLFLVLLGQLLLRSAAATSDDLTTLAMLGMTRRDIVRLGAARGAVVGSGGALLAVVVGIVASPTMPVGLARIAEPNPGFRVDGRVLVFGAAIVVLIAAILGALAAQRVHAWSRAADRRRVAMPLPALSPALHAGLSMLVRPGRRRDAGVVRTSIASLCFVVASVVAVSVTIASLTRVQQNAPLVGATWDGVVQIRQDGSPSAEELDAAVRKVAALPDVAAASSTGWGPAKVNGQDVQAQLFADPARIGPAVAAGRVPLAAGELAMGADTMRKLRVHRGDHVQLQLTENSKPVDAEIVGTSVLVPPIFYQSGPGDGIAVPRATMERAGVARTDAAALVVARFRDGANVHRSLVRMADALGGYSNVFAFSSRDRTVVQGIQRVGTAPRALVAILAVLGLAAFVHVLLVSTRRRRIDIVVLRAIGFTRGQVLSTTGVQAVGIATLALVVGVPLGVVAGRFGWNRFSEYLRLVPSAIVPVAAIGVVVLVVAGAACIAAVPAGMRAARIRAAEVLRTEG